ncbi:exopolyphosphatase [Hydrogenophaga sp. 5NK40-0174]|uniref:exopolyphosphatase n=1 Tax=Hydrogenophaga sp. 5NK40-0174 TaxID=3127649 RepID=UPI003105ECE2
MQNGTLLAAIDLGSNSFRLEIGRVQVGHVERVEYLKETVRQGSGLDENKVLSQEAMQRGWDCLARFAERLHGFKKAQVRAVATQTLREARNREDFLSEAQAVLGFPIEVISGQEEARLIYQGVSHLLPQSEERRLVVDIGGRSTEMMLGQGYEARAMESYRLGSVAWSARYFPKGQFTNSAFRTAEVAAKAVLDEALDRFPPTEWEVAYGSSGTVGAVADALASNGWAAGVITRSGLEWLQEKLIKAGNVDRLKLEGIKPERKAVIAGGLSVLQAIFDLFGIDQMLPAQGALRQGALYDLIERDTEGGDVRERTVQWLAQRFSIDAAQADRVSKVAKALFVQIAQDDAGDGRYSRKLEWASRLHEIGTHISHERSYHHGAYILDNVDAPGFSMPELHRMSQLVLGQRGKLKKVGPVLREELFAKQLACLRLAVILCHARQMPEYEAVTLGFDGGKFRLGTLSGWAKRYPQSAWLLSEEANAWRKTDWQYSADIR